MKKSFLSTQAKEFRSKYNLNNDATRQTRQRQLDLIIEEFKEFLEAEGMLFRHGRNAKEECLKELADLPKTPLCFAPLKGTPTTLQA